MTFAWHASQAMLDYRTARAAGWLTGPRGDQFDGIMARAARDGMAWRASALPARQPRGRWTAGAWVLKENIRPMGNCQSAAGAMRSLHDCAGALPGHLRRRAVALHPTRVPVEFRLPFLDPFMSSPFPQR